MTQRRTCATPTFLPGIERPEIFSTKKTDDDEWDLLYNAAKILIGTSTTEFDYSIRHNIVLEALQKSQAFSARDVKPLPLACHRLANTRYVRWHAAENVSTSLLRLRARWC